MNKNVSTNDVRTEEQTIKEECVMTRKAEEITSFKQLNLDPKMRARIKKIFVIPENAIWRGRELYYYHTFFPEDESNLYKYEKALIAALDNAGLIRHDITPESFALYDVFNSIVAIRGRDSNPHLLNCYNGLIYCYYCIPYRYSDGIFAKFVNREYETFQNPSREQLDLVKKYCLDALGEEAYQMFAFKAGLTDGHTHGIEEAMRRFMPKRFPRCQNYVRYIRMLLKHSRTNAVQEFYRLEEEINRRYDKIQHLANVFSRDSSIVEKTMLENKEQIEQEGELMFAAHAQLNAEVMRFFEDAKPADSIS